MDGQCESCPNGQIVVNGVCQGMECFVPLISMSYLWLWNTCEMRRFFIDVKYFFEKHFRVENVVPSDRTENIYIHLNDWSCSVLF